MTVSFHTLTTHTARMSYVLNHLPIGTRTEYRCRRVTCESRLRGAICPAIMEFCPSAVKQRSLSYVWMKRHNPYCPGISFCLLQTMFLRPVVQKTRRLLNFSCNTVSAQSAAGLFEVKQSLCSMLIWSVLCRPIVKVVSVLRTIPWRCMGGWK